MNDESLVLISEDYNYENDIILFEDNKYKIRLSRRGYSDEWIYAYDLSMYIKRNLNQE